MAQVMSLPDAVAQLVGDGDSVALEGFTHLIPFAAGHEIIRQGRRELELIRMTPDLLYDQMIGMGVARRLVFSYGGNPGVGGLHRFRDAIENEWPRPVEIEEHSHAGMANRYAAGAADMPCAVMRGYVGTDLIARTRVAPVTCPFTGEQLVAVPALRPDVAIVHAQEADRDGNVQLWGIPGVQKEAVLAAQRSLVTVERIVDQLELRPGGIVIPEWVITAVAEAPGGSRPSYSLGITERDNDFYKFWDKLSRDRDQFNEWMNENVLGQGVPADMTATATEVTAGETQTVVAARRLTRHQDGVHRRGPPEHRGDPGPHGAQPRADPGLRVGDDRRQAVPHPALDRRRRAGRDGRLDRVGARDVQLLDRRGPDRRRVPGRGADRPPRESQLDRDRRLRPPQDAAAGRRRRAGDRRQLRRGDRDRGPRQAHASSRGSTSSPPSGTATVRVRASASASAAAGRPR